VLPDLDGPLWELVVPVADAVLLQCALSIIKMLACTAANMHGVASSGSKINKATAAWRAHLTEVLNTLY
jgi:hypothetical protein